MDEGFVPPWVKKRKCNATDGSANQRILPSKKSKAELSVNRQASYSSPISKRSFSSKSVSKSMVKTRPCDQDARAGPSTRKNVIMSPPSSPTGASSQIGRPTSRKITKMISLESDTDFGSGDGPSLGISIPKRDKVRKRKLRQRQSISPTQTTSTAVHLGAIELTDSEDDEPPKRPFKRRKIFTKPSLKDSVIDLCSDDEIDLLGGTTTPIRTRVVDRVLKILSSDDGDKERLRVTKEIEQEMFDELDPLHFLVESSKSAQAFGEHGRRKSIGIDVSTPASRIIDEFNLLETKNSVKKLKRSTTEDDPKLLQESYNEALERWNSKSPAIRSRVFESQLSTSKFTRPMRGITFSDDLPPLDLHTPIFFSRAVSDVKALLEVARKRQKKRRAQAIRDSNQSVPTRQKTPQRAPVSPIDVVMVDPGIDTSPSLCDDLHSTNLLQIKSSRATTILSTALIGRNISQILSDTDCPVDEMASSLLRQAQSPEPSTLPRNFLDAQISELIFPTLSETHNQDEDEDDSSCLEFSYPSAGVY